MDTPLTAAAPAETTAVPAAPARQPGHPLIWGALLVWLSIEAIGDALLALRTVLTTSSSRGTTPTVTPS